MTEYHKINAIFKRYTDGPNRGKLIMGDWAVPEIGYLADNQWEFTEKVDGTNIRVNILINNGVVMYGFLGRTDNADIPKPLQAALDKMFTESREATVALVKMSEERGIKELTLYGEGYGPKIQSGGLYRDDQSFVLFDVKIGDFWLDRKNVNDIAEKLGIDSVPVLGTGTIWDAINIVKTGETFKDGTVHQFGGSSSSGFVGMKSAWGDFEAEGIVARPVVPLFNRKGERIIAKIKARDFR